MLVKMTRSELMNLLNGFNIVNTLEGFKLAYAVARNKRALVAEQSLLKKATKHSDKYKEYDTKRIELCQKYALKDEAGKPKLTMGPTGMAYEGVNENPNFQEDLKVLKEEHKESIDNQEKKQEDYAKMLEEEIEFDLYMVQSDQLPKNITVQQLDAIMPMVEHTEH